MNVFEFQNYRDFLKAELALRIENNSKYSLRALAKSLEIGSSTLSEVMSGKTNLSLDRARQVGKKLKLKVRQQEYFCELVQFESTKDQTLRQEIAERLRRFHPQKLQITDLNLESFKQIAEWVHSIILELPQIPGFEMSPQNIAQTLRIAKPQAELALDRLLKLGLLSRDEKGKIQRSDARYKVHSDAKNEAMRLYYGQMLKQVAGALSEQSPQERLSGFLNLAVSNDALPEIDQAIDRFFSEVKAIAEKHNPKTNVYHLSLHMINTTKGSLK